MSDLVLNALRRNVVIHAHNPEKVARLKKRIAELEKAQSEDLAELTKAELLEEAERRGVDVPKNATKAEIIDDLSDLADESD